MAGTRKYRHTYLVAQREGGVQNSSRKRNDASPKDHGGVVWGLQRTAERSGRTTVARALVVLWTRCRDDDGRDRINWARLRPVIQTLKLALKKSSTPHIVPRDLIQQPTTACRIDTVHADLAPSRRGATPAGIATALPVDDDRPACRECWGMCSLERRLHTSLPPPFGSSCPCFFPVSFSSGFSGAAFYPVLDGLPP